MGDARPGLKRDMIDILMITFNRPTYTRLALERLLETCDDTMRVWLWHNGNDGATLDVVRALADHPRVQAFHHSPENKKLHEPTNWLWSNANGAYVSKVDDDCLLPDGWAQTLRRAHEDVPELGVVGCWRFEDEDFVPELAKRKIRSFHGGHRVLQNLWVEGSGYLMKRACLNRNGLLRDGESFPQYCIRLAKAGFVHGWYFPLIRQEHMDDPRSPNTLLRTDEDLHKYLPLSARNNGVTTLSEWQSQLRRSARLVQESSLDLREYAWWRTKLKSLHRRIRSLAGIKRQW
jgi:glycosyltransferase involved in cell wall biosynthesis